jgi:tRNA-2-methylthio-N6-dimethylallyladenosine synthase
LKAMRRNYTRKEFLLEASRLRARLPKVALTTDIIVGFPQETEEDFRQTLSFVEEAQFDAAFCFKFSARAGTTAARMDGQVPEAVKEERLREVLERVVGQARRASLALVGTRQEVLVEEPGFGRSRTNRSVVLPRQAGRPGELVPVRIAGVRGNTLAGELEGGIMGKRREAEARGRR